MRTKVFNKYREYSRLIWLITTCCLLICLLVFTLVNRHGAQPTPPVGDEANILKVETFEVGGSQIYTKTIAKTENSNKITVSSISSGIVNKISVDLGDGVVEDEKLLILTQTYTGDDAFDIQVDLAQTQLDLAEEQLDILNSNESERIDLADEQLDEFLGRQALLEGQVPVINQQITTVETLMLDIQTIIEQYVDFADEIEDNAPDDFTEEQMLLINQATILGQQQALAQYQTTLDSLNTRLDQVSFEISSNYPGTAIAEITNELAESQIRSEIDLAEINVELAELNLALVESQEDLRTVTSPVIGTIEQIKVREGELVNPGMPLFIVNGELDLVLISKVTPEIALQVDQDESAVILIDNIAYKASVEFVSNVPIEGNLYEIRLNPSNDLEEKLQIGMSLEISLPVTTTSTTTPEEGDEPVITDEIYVPIDSIFKTNTREFVLIYEDGIAVEREVVTSNTIGNQIRILEGLSSGDQVILDRRVIPGQSVEIISEESEEDEEDESENTGEESESTPTGSPTPTEEPPK